MNDKEAQQLTFKQFFTEADDISRRDFLGKLGRGLSMAANLPWTKLFSAPELATKVTAPFLMGANKVINPLQMYQAFYKRIREQWYTDMGTAYQKWGTSFSDAIPDFVVQYVAKNMLEYTADNYEYTDDASQHFLTDILDELDKGKQHVLDDPWVPQYIKNDVAANYHEEEEGVPSGDIENLNHDNIVGALYLSPDTVNNQEVLDNNIEDSLERALGNTRNDWTQAWEESETPLLSTILGYIEDLIHPVKQFDWNPRTIYQKNKPGGSGAVSPEDVVKMDFKSQILPGTVNWLRALKVQNVIDHERYNQDVAKHQADKETDARNNDYLDRRPSFPHLPDHGRGWESKKMKTDADLIFEAYLEADMSRRSFLGKLGKGVSLVANIPWTKLISAPQLAATVTAPFKIGAGTMLNPEALHWYYVHKFYNKALDSGLTPVDVADERHYEYDHTEISHKAFDWVAKNVINMYVDDVGHSTDREGNTVAPTLSDLINHHGWEEEHFIDDPNFPEWAKPLLAKDEEDMTDEEEKRYQNLMNSKWFDKQMVINWDGEWGHGADEEIEEMLGNWTGWHHNNPRWTPGEDELIDTVFDYIIHLNNKKMDINEIMKMDFKQEFLPGVAKYARAMAASPGGTDIEYEPDAQRAADADTSGGGLDRQRRPGQERSEQEYWDDRRHAFSDEELVDEYRDFAQMILNNSDNPRFSDPKLQKEAQMFLDELERRYPPKPSRHPYGVGSPQSGLQTASTKPTFKEFFNEMASPYPLKLDVDKIRDMYQRGLTTREIGKQLGVTNGTIVNRLKAMGIERRPQGPIRGVVYKQLDDEKIKQMYQDGFSTYDIGKQLGVSHSTILSRLKSMGIERRSDGGPRAMLDNEKIKQMYQDGFSTYDIGKQLGVDKGTIINRLKAIGVRIRSTGEYAYKQLDNEKIKQMYQDGYTAVDIGKQLGVSYKTIYSRLKSMGIERRTRGDYTFKRGSDLRNPSQMRTRNITGPGNVGGAHQTFHGSPQTVQTNLPGPRRGKGH
jgi:DNA-binding NarL/FixJ family response regulator